MKLVLKQLFPELYYEIMKEGFCTFTKTEEELTQHIERDIEVEQTILSEWI
jgi:hypothetical protein